MADGIVNWEEANFTWSDNSYVWSLILEIVESSNGGDAVKRKLEKLPEKDKKKFIRLIMRRRGIKMYNERKEVKNIKAYVEDVKMIAEEIKANVQIIHG
jgi:putative heme iron utilization protein